MARQRAGLFLIKDGRIALIERHRRGHHYWTFPGGGVDEDETPAQAAAREAVEELGLEVTVGPRILELHERWFGRDVQHYFLATTDVEAFGEMTGPEADEHPDVNRYTPQWVPLDELAALPLLPEPAKAIAVAGEPWPTETVVVRTDHEYPPPGE